jgi:hypothetical protein
VGHIIEDPFNMPQPNPMDDMKFEGSFKVVREDVMERLPATDPLLEVRKFTGMEAYFVHQTSISL